MSTPIKGKVSSNTGSSGGKPVSLPKVNNNSKAPVKACNTTVSPAKQTNKLPHIHTKNDVSKKQQESNNKAADPVLSDNILNDSDNNSATESDAARLVTAGTNTISEQPSDANNTVELKVSSINISEIPVVTNSEEEPKVEKEAENIPEEVKEPIKRDGDVRLIYEQYSELFPIVNGSTTQAAVDDVYCLSFVMPDCLVHLSVHDPPSKRQLEIDGKLTELFLSESPLGVYQNLEADKTYYVYVEQQADQLARDQAITRQRLQTDVQTLAKLEKDDGRVMESCSCIYGNPCVDEYGCRDWTNRFAIAKNNGWKGF